MNDTQKKLKKKAARLNYIHKKRANGGDLTNEQMERVLLSTHCYWCKTPLDNIVSHVDHLVPISKGGKHTVSNVALTCQSCNNSKKNIMPDKFQKIINGELSTNTVNVRIPYQVRDKLKKLSKKTVCSMGEMIELMIDQNKVRNYK